MGTAIVFIIHAQTPLSGGVPVASPRLVAARVCGRGPLLLPKAYIISVAYVRVCVWFCRSVFYEMSFSNRVRRFARAKGKSHPKFGVLVRVLKRVCACVCVSAHSTVDTYTPCRLRTCRGSVLRAARHNRKRHKKARAFWAQKNGGRETNGCTKDIRLFPATTLGERWRGHMHTHVRPNLYRILLENAWSGRSFFLLGDAPSFTPECHSKFSVVEPASAPGLGLVCLILSRSLSLCLFLCYPTAKLDTMGARSTSV